jgi:hypothetical protein
LAGDRNTKHPFLNNALLNPSGEKLSQLFHVNDFEISAPQNPTSYSPTGNGDVLDIVVHKIRLSYVTVSDILNSDHFLTVFYILEHVTTKKLSEPFKKFRDWERFQSLASNLILPGIEIKCGLEANKVALEFTNSIASAYRLSTSKVKLSKLNSGNLIWCVCILLRV